MSEARPSIAMTPDRWQKTSAYLRTVFGREDAALDGLMDRAVAAGLPAIAISADVGRLLKVVASMTNAGRGPALAIEVGTLAGYSGVWIARALAPGGKLVTIEYEREHADFARAMFEHAGVADRVEIVVGAGLEVLPRLAERFGPASVDFAFLDAVKSEYPGYARTLAPMMRAGGVLAADNVLGSSRWWIDEPAGSGGAEDAASRAGVDAFNRAMAADARFETVAVPSREGVLLARRVAP